MLILRQTTHNFIGVRDKVGLTLAITALAVLAVHWIVIFSYIIPRLGTLDFLRLHYTATLGVDWVGEWWKIFIFPLAGLLVFFINGFFSVVLAKRHRVLGLVALGATLVTEVLFATGGIMAVLLNG